jgi:hypothetical protein
MPRTEIFTFFTKARETLLYSAEDWIECQLTLQTAGPVSVSTRKQIEPVLSGKGILLVPGEPFEVTLDKGDRLYIAAEAVNRIAFVTQPFPYLQEVIDYQAAQFSLFSKTLGLEGAEVLPPQRPVAPPAKRGDLHETGRRPIPPARYQLPYRGNK